MPNRLVGILVCLLLANIAAYALGNWVEHLIYEETQLVDRNDNGLSLSLLANLEIELDEFPHTDDRMQVYYRYVASGGADRYLTSTEQFATIEDSPLLVHRWRVVLAADAARMTAVGLLLLIGLLLLGRGLREEKVTTPFVLAAIVVATAATFGAFLAPLFTLATALAISLYAGSLRLFLPIYTTEISRLMRPFLTPCMVLLVVIAWRGPELVDYLFWTSAWFRFLLCFVWLLAHFFHFAVLDRILRRMEYSLVSRIFAYALPLGVTWLGVGLLLGAYGEAAGAGLGVLNRELMLVPQAMLEALNPEAPFALFFAGATLLILGGIGHYVQRIAG